MTSRAAAWLSVVVLTLSACPPEEDPYAGECPIGGPDTGFGLQVDFVGRVDGEGGTATGGATMFTAPAAPVTVPLAVREQFEVTPTSLTFTPENWNVPQAVTVRAKPGVRTADITEGTTTSLLLGPTKSSDESLRCQTGVSGLIPLPRCGDGVVDPHLNEDCEGPLDRPICALGEASCRLCGRECRLVDGVPNVCGDGMVTADEQCDGTPRLTCEGLGYDFGTSRCSPTTCQHDPTDCVRVTRCDAGTAGCDPLFPAPEPDDDGACLLASDGRARCWGVSAVGHQRSPPAAYAQLADGPAHACGLTSGGTVQCWGENRAGQATPRGGPYAKVVVGDYHSCGLGTDGTVTCWGSDDYRLSQVPAGAPFADLASGRNHVCALTATGEAKCWGRRSEAQTFPPAALRFTRLAAAANHSCGLTAMGEVHCWGNFGRGSSALVMPSSWPFVDLLVTRQDVCGLTADDRVVCATQNTGDLRPPYDFVPVSLGDASSGLCALDAQGRAECWGQFDAREKLVGAFRRVDNGFRFCGVRTDGQPVCGGSTVTTSGPVVQFVMPDVNTSCAVFADGGANCLMRWESGGQARSANAPTVPFERLVVFDQATCGLRAGGTAVCWGNLPSSGLGVPQEPLSDFAHNGVTGCGVVAATGALACWGADPFGIRTPPAGTFTQVRMNRVYACGLRTDGSVTCWGEAPPAWPTGSDFTALAMGENGGACALHGDGGLACWGRENLTGVPHARFAALRSSTLGAAGLTDDGGLRAFWPNAPAFEPGAVALVDARIDELVTGSRSFCVRHGEGIFCLSPEDDATRPLRDVTGGQFGTDLPGRQCWLLDGGLPRCNSGSNPRQVPLGKLVVAGPGIYGLTLDGGDLVNAGADLFGGPFTDLVATEEVYCVRRPSPRRWECAGHADAGVRGQHPDYDRVALGRTHDLACGLADGGAVTCWGRGVTRSVGGVPAGPWSELSLGLTHGCGLRPDASVECWGDATNPARLAPAGAFDTVGVGNEYACGVRAGSRRLVCWGKYGVNDHR